MSSSSQAVKYYKHPTPRPAVARAIANAISRQRTGESAPEFSQRSGRIDKRALRRIPLHDPTIFYRQNAPSPLRLRHCIVLDASGSMASFGRAKQSSSLTKAAQMVHDLLLAGQSMPQVRSEVWSHTTAGPHWGAPAEGCSVLREGKFVLVHELWQEGDGLPAFAKRLDIVELWGNEDGWALDIIAKEAEAGLRPEERLLITMVSDGQPRYIEDDPFAVGTEKGKGWENSIKHVRSVTDALKRRGHIVVGVSIDPSLTAKTQESMYGRGNVIPYSSDTKRLTMDIAKVMGKALR